jgi:hypothetical protein
MTRIGERLGAGTGANLPRILKMPPAASAFWQDGRFLDAGTAMILDSNLAHLAHESTRHIGWSLGPGALTHSPDLTASGWDGYEDTDAPTSAPLIDAPLDRVISWDERTAMDFGPIFGVQDHTNAAGLDVLRRVAVAVHCDAPTPSGDNGLHLYAALTLDPSPPSQNNALAWARTGSLVNPQPLVAGEGVATLDLQVADPADPSLVVRSRADGSHGPTSHRALAYWVWVGWRSNLSGARIISVSAYERR